MTRPTEVLLGALVVGAGFGAATSNEVVEAIGKTIVWTAAAASIGFIVVHFLLVERHRRSLAAAESP